MSMRTGVAEVIRWCSRQDCIWQDMLSSYEKSEIGYNVSQDIQNQFHTELSQWRANWNMTLNIRWI